MSTSCVQILPTAMGVSFRVWVFRFLQLVRRRLPAGRTYRRVLKVKSHALWYDLDEPQNSDNELVEAVFSSWRRYNNLLSVSAPFSITGIREAAC